MQNHQYLIPVAVIKNTEGKVLFIKKSQARSLIAVDRWELPGGTIMFGDSFEQSLVKKINSYLGIEITINSIIPYVHSTVTKGYSKANELIDMQFFLIGVLCNLKNPAQPFLLQKGKIAEAIFLSIDEYQKLPKEQIVPGDKEILEAANLL